MEKDKPSLLNEFEYKGLWWLPDMPEKQSWGILKYTPNEGAELELMGDLWNRIEEPLIILGLLVNGQPVTLYKCHWRGEYGAVRKDSVKITKIYVQLIFIGAKFDNKNEIVFKKIIVGYSNLDQWVNKYILEIMDNYIDEFKVKYKYNNINLYNHNNWNISVNIVPSITRSIQMLNIVKETYVNFESINERSINDFIDLIWMFRNFMSLALLYPACPLMNKAEIVMKKNDKTPPIIVDIIAAGLFTNLPKKIESRHQLDMLFTFKDMDQSYCNMINKWIEISYQLKLGLNHFFGTIYDPKMYLEDQFINIYQAIESYIKYKNNNKNINMEKEFNNLIKPLLSISNNMISNINNFIKKIIVSRQYLIHSDNTKEKRSISGGELYPIIIRLRILFKLILLSEIGFSLENIEKLIAKNIAIKRLLSIEMIKWE